MAILRSLLLSTLLLVTVGYFGTDLSVTCKISALTDGIQSVSSIIESSTIGNNANSIIEKTLDVKSKSKMSVRNKDGSLRVKIDFSSRMDLKLFSNVTQNLLSAVRSLSRNVSSFGVLENVAGKFVEQLIVLKENVIVIKENVSDDVREVIDELNATLKDAILYTQEMKERSMVIVNNKVLSKLTILDDKVVIVLKETQLALNKLGALLERVQVLMKRIFETVVANSSKLNLYKLGSVLSNYRIQKSLNINISKEFELDLRKTLNAWKLLRLEQVIGIDAQKLFSVLTSNALDKAFVNGYHKTIAYSTVIPFDTLDMIKNSIENLPSMIDEVPRVVGSVVSNFDNVVGVAETTNADELLENVTGVIGDTTNSDIMGLVEIVKASSISDIDDSIIDSLPGDFIDDVSHKVSHYLRNSSNVLGVEVPEELLAVTGVVI